MAGLAHDLPSPLIGQNRRPVVARNKLCADDRPRKGLRLASFVSGWLQGACEVAGLKGVLGVGSDDGATRRACPAALVMLASRRRLVARPPLGASSGD